MGDRNIVDCEALPKIGFDALGSLADFCLLPGQAHDLRGVLELIEGLRADYMLADRAFDADWLRQTLSEHGISPVIPPRKNRKHPADYDQEMYKWRHLVENFFQKIKDYRGIATATARQTAASPHSFLWQVPCYGSNERQHTLSF